MNFLATFYSNVILGISVTLICFSVMGLHLLSCLGLLKHWRQFWAYLLAPALGLIIFSILSLCSNYYFNYHSITMITTWLIYHVVLYSWQYFYKPNVVLESFPYLSLNKLLLLWIFIGLWAFLPVLSIAPYITNDALFVNPPIFDHAKIAIIDSISRHGLPAINPYYSPAGEQILLMYYYLWHFVAAELSTLLNITGWQADIVLTWLTGFCSFSFIAGLAIYLTQKARSGFYIVALGSTTDIAELMQVMFARGQLWERWLALPDTHIFELPYLQISWAPQHFFSALGVVVILFLFAMLLQIKNHSQRIFYAVIIGLIAAAGIGSSIWVGGVALLFALPIILSSVLLLKLPKETYLQTGKLLIISLFMCVITVSPILFSLLSHSNENSSISIIDFSIYPSTRVINQETFFGKIIHSFLFWFQFLPLTLGIVYLWGGFTVLLQRSTSLSEQIWKYISIGGIVGFFIVAQFVKSNIANNDLAWRAISVANLLLMVWAAVGLTHLSSGQIFEHWKYKCLKRYQNVLLVPVVYGLFFIGLFGFIKIWTFPNPFYYGKVTEEKLSLHQSFMQQYNVWQRVQYYTEKNERVQMNPDGYAELTPWAALLPYMLFANRNVAYANPEYVNNFAYRYNKQSNQQQYEQIRQVFQGNVTSNALIYLRDTLKIALLVVDPHDPLWNSNFLDTSNSYKLIYGDNFCKLYRAIK